MIVAIRRRSRFRFIALVAVCLLGVSAFSTGCNYRDLGARSQTLINNERGRAGLRPLAWDDNAAGKAQAWAQQLASNRSLAHSRLTDGISGGWTVLGENVGFARTVDDTHGGFMNSPKHREAIMNGRYSSVGIGVAQNGNLVYVVQVFRG